VMRYQAPRTTAQLATIARVLQLADAGPDNMESALLAADAVSDLIGRLELPRHLREVGIDEGDLHNIAVATVGEGPQLAEIEQLLARML